jgi:PAS domain S-box-containing protein
MSKPLRVLIVDESEEDAQLIVRELRRGGFDPTYERCDTQAAFKAALEWKTWDVIVADYELPRFNGLTALGIARETGLDIPFVLVSNTIGESLAVTAMKAGAQDYVLKSEMARLPAAVEREVREAKVRRKRREIEETLQRSYRSFRQVMDSAPDGIGVVREEKLIYANQALAACFGHESTDDLVGASPWSLLAREERAPAEAWLREVLESKHAAPPREYRGVRVDGAVVSLEVAASFVENFDGLPALVVFVRDSTEKRRAMAQVILADRLVATGMLASSAALELNNPLAYVASNLTFLAEEIQKFENELGKERVVEMNKAVGEAKGGIDRIRSLVRDLRSLSTTEEETRIRVDVRAALESAMSISMSEVRSRAHLTKDFAVAPRVVANEGRLIQLFVALLTNAAQAMEQKDLDTNEIRVSLRADGLNVVVTIADNGRGLTEEELSKVFDPLYLSRTSAPAGVSLSVAKTIAQSVGGELTVESAPQRGTTAKVTLPGAEVRAASREMMAARAASLPPGQARVLLVDDEPLISASLRRLLMRDCEVVVANGGAPALATLAKDEAFDVIFCDLMMPDVTGMDVYAELRKDRPELADRVVFLTGAGFTPRIQEFLNRVPNARMDKPVDVQKIRAIVRERAAARK